MRSSINRGAQAAADIRVTTTATIRTSRGATMSNPKNKNSQNATRKTRAQVRKNQGHNEIGVFRPITEIGESSPHSAETRKKHTNIDEHARTSRETKNKVKRSLFRIYWIKTVHRIDEDNSDALTGCPLCSFSVHHVHCLNPVNSKK